MRIVMISETIGNAFGQEKVVHASTEALQAEGHTVHCIARFAVEPNTPGSVTLLPELFSLGSLSSPTQKKQVLGRFKEALDRCQPDIVHFIDMVDARALAVARSQYPVIFTAHTAAPTCPASGRFIPPAGACEKTSGWQCLWHHHRQNCLHSYRSDVHRLHAVYEFERKKKQLCQFDGVFAISRYLENRLVAEGYPRERVFYVPNPVTTPRVERLADAPSPLLVCAARLVKMKGVDFLLRALQPLQARAWTLWVLGEGPERASLEALTVQLGLSSRVQFCGRTSYAETQRIFASASLVLQTNAGPEGFGLSLAEASLHAVPVVAFAVPALSELIEDSKTGYLIPLGDTAALAQCVQNLLDDPLLARRLGEAGRLKMQTQYTPAVHVRATLAAYQLCQQRRGWTVPTVAVASTRTTQIPG